MLPPASVLVLLVCDGEQGRVAGDGEREGLGYDASDPFVAEAQGRCEGEVGAARGAEEDDAVWVCFQGVGVLFALLGS